MEDIVPANHQYVTADKKTTHAASNIASKYIVPANIEYFKVEERKYRIS